MIYRIHEDDVPIMKGKQWYTRMLYNAYPPFRLNFVIDTHVYPCDRDSTIQLFSQFDKSQVDLSVGNRVNKRDYIWGAGILFRSNPKTKAFWIEVYQTMRRLNNPDDQSGIYRVLFNKNPPNLSFRWLSFNWCYASHGINEKGVFEGGGYCYRSSLPVNGKVHFIHGSPGECEIMNGKNGELENRQRCYFSSGICNTTQKGTTVAFNEEQFKSFVSPYEAPNLYWKIFESFPNQSIFWPERNGIK